MSTVGSGSEQGTIVDPTLLDAIIELAKQRALLLAALRVALEAKDLVRVEQLARRLCGLSD